MPIDPKGLYDQAFEAHRHASDYRVKIIGGWAAIYTAFAGVFVWVQTNQENLTWVVILAAGLMTVMMWLADIRNRPAIGRAKDIGANIEQDADSGIPEDRRFFSKLDKGVSHSRIIDIFALVSLGILVAAAYGEIYVPFFPRESLGFNIGWVAITRQRFGIILVVIGTVLLARSTKVKRQYEGGMAKFVNEKKGKDLIEPTEVSIVQSRFRSGLFLIAAGSFLQW